jgi:hypothetical protein
MPFPRRLIVMAALAAVALTAYGTSRYFSASLITYVVEHALLQKLPPGADPIAVRGRFHGLMSELPDRRAKLEKLLFLSQYLEKVQRLTSRELDELLK